MRILYAGIDLHSNNNYIGILDEKDQQVFRNKLTNDLNVVLKQLEPFREDLKGVVVESTYNWYWLVDGLREAGYRVHLANPAAIQQYSGLKHTDDQSDAFFLAHLLRLGLLAEGYIYPKETRPLRDLLRKRSQLVQKKTAHLLSIQNLFARNSGKQMSSNRVKNLTIEELHELVKDEELELAIESNLAVMQVLQQQIKTIEKSVLAKVKLKEEFQKLLTVDGIGKILGLTIMLETGEINRFSKVGNFTSYCRCVSSQKWSNGKKKGEGNRKNGNKYLSWAFVEAAHCAIRVNEQAKRYYQRKKAKTNGAVASKALANKLARACYYVMRDQVSFEASKLFAY